MSDVLVVEPGELGELLTTLLSQYGIDARHVRSGEHALEAALRDRPGVVVADVQLGDSSGLDLVELLAHELGARTIVTFSRRLAANPPSKDFLPRLARVDAHFQRPFRSLLLVEAAARLLGRTLPGRAPSALTSSEGAAVAFDELSELPPMSQDEEFSVDVELTPPPFSVEVPEAAPPLLPTEADKKPFLPGELTELWQRAKARRADPAPVVESAESRLSPRSYADLLDAFRQAQTTGEVWLKKGDARRVLLFRRGVLVGARSNVEGEDIARTAERLNLLDAETLRAAQADVRADPNATLVDALLRRGAVNESVLQRLVNDTVRRIALAAFLWREGSYRVTLQNRAAKEPVQAKVSVADVIVRGIMLTESDDGLHKAAPDDARFAPVGDAAYSLAELQLSADEARLVVAMDGTKTIADLVTLFPNVTPRAVRGLAAGLYCVQLVRFAGQGEASARRISYF